MALRQNPAIYEINTWVWLHDLSERYGKTITLATVPLEVFDELASWNIDAIWLMGVWERSDQSREIAFNHPDLQFEFSKVIPKFTQDDVIGSAYAIKRYAVAGALGGREGLAIFRRYLRERNIGLLLDYVPNHVGVDHHWTDEDPECLIEGTEADLLARPGFYYQAANGRIFAHGRDPYFPAWTDTAQINTFSKAGRQKSLETLLDIAEQCDGVRCDMAMLMVNRVFAGLWGEGMDVPETEFWVEIIPAVRAKHTDFIFMAEVYWEMEAELQSQGFDYTYDKRLYDRMLLENVHSVRDHLLAASSYQRHLVRFTENHDEHRAMESFGYEKSKASITTAMMLPGAKLLHEGQFEGRKVKVPVQLRSRPKEKPHKELVEFYRRLLHEAGKSVYHDGTFMALAAHPILGSDPGHENLLAFAWVLGDDWRVAVINFSDHYAKGRIMLPRPEFTGANVWAFNDALNLGTRPLYPGDDLITSGLPIELPPYGAHLFAVEKA